MYRVDKPVKGSLCAAMRGTLFPMMTREEKAQVVLADSKLDEAFDADPLVLSKKVSIECFGDCDDEFTTYSRTADDLLEVVRNTVRKRNASAVFISCPMVSDGKRGVSYHVELFHGTMKVTLIVKLDGSKLLLIGSPFRLGEIFDEPDNTKMQWVA